MTDTTSPILIDAVVAAAAYSAVSTCQGRDRHQPETFSIVRFSVWHDVGVALSATDRRSVAEAWIPLRGADRPDREADDVFNVVDSANRVRGLLAHAAKEEDERLEIRLVTEEGGLPGFGGQTRIEFALGERERLRASTLGGGVDIGKVFSAFNAEPCAVVPLAPEISGQLAQITKAVGAVSLEMSPTMVHVTPAIDPGFKFRAVLVAGG